MNDPRFAGKTMPASKRAAMQRLIQALCPGDNKCGCPHEVTHFRWHAGEEPSNSRRIFSGNSCWWQKKELSRVLKSGVPSSRIVGRSGLIEAGATLTEASSAKTIIVVLVQLTQLLLWRRGLRGPRVAQARGWTTAPESHQTPTKPL